MHYVNWILATIVSFGLGHSSAYFGFGDGSLNSLSALAGLALLRTFIIEAEMESNDQRKAPHGPTTHTP